MIAVEIVFTKDVPNQARAGEVRRVADGFARNYLIPRGLAEVATQEVLKRLHKITAAGDENRIRETKVIEELVEVLDGVQITVAARVTPTGRYYGAITAAQIADGLAASKTASRDLIQRENAKPGTRDWILTNTYIDPDTWWRNPRIEGYCSETRVRSGDTLKIMVSTNPVSEFSLEIFRTGYYGGKGRRGMKKFDSIQGKAQPDPEIGENRLRECKWEPSVE